ncbi:uncharacterized protein LOC124418237 isoform X2 [Gallus gallus]|uniref:uncharacterized protein LOC124418237 isoform X2 n=1 Tax=Gallus gallus TaxID=9031 RepID=UPI001F030C6E|nr:uncharacterized protein LOC124418237 isoform X2 [Gallus gallus]
MIHFYMMSVRDSGRYVEGETAGQDPCVGAAVLCLAEGPGAKECRGARSASVPCAPLRGSAAATVVDGAGPGRAEWGGGRCPGTARRGAARARPRSAAVRLPGRRQRRGGARWRPGWGRDCWPWPWGRQGSGFNFGSLLYCGIVRHSVAVLSGCPSSTVGHILLKFVGYMVIYCGNLVG